MSPTCPMCKGSGEVEDRAPSSSGGKFADELPDFKRDMIDYEGGRFRLWLDAKATAVRDDLKENVPDRWWHQSPDFYWSVPLGSLEEFIAFLERNADRFTITKRAALVLRLEV